MKKKLQGQENLEEQNKLIESQAIMAPEAFETQRIEYENNQKYNVERQKAYFNRQSCSNIKERSTRCFIPILEEISNEKVYNSIRKTALLNAENMDITNEAQKLNKQLPSIKVSAD